MDSNFFYDNLDSVGDEPLLVEATISLLATDQGGKERPIAHHYRPNHNFGGPDNRNMFIGQVELEDGELLYPGQTKNLMVRFPNVRGLREHLAIGTEWRIQEGMHLVGFGVVKCVRET
jgi:elongation factor Tu